MSELELNAAQKDAWQVLRKILRWYSQSVAALSPFEVEIWKAYHFGAPQPQPRNDRERFTLENTSLENFLKLLLDPNQSEEIYRRIVSGFRILDRGHYAYDLPIKFNQLFKATGYPACAGKTEWLIGLLVDGWETSRDEWMQSFYFDTFMGEIVTWLGNGGYRQFPCLPVFPPAVQAFIATRDRLNWNKNDLRGYNEPYPLIFHFKDPERLPPESSPYYYFASRAQQYLCREAKLPEPMERYVIEAAQLKVARLADYKILPQLPRPACYDEKPAANEQEKSKRRLRKSAPLYDEAYGATDPDYPFPPLRYAAKSENASKSTLSAILALFIEQGFVKTVPKIKQGNAAPYLSWAWREPPPRKGIVKAWMCSFKPHLSLSRSDALSLKITLLVSKSPLPIFKGAFVPFEQGGGVTARAQTCNIVLYIDQPNREEIGPDSSLMQNLHRLLQDIKSRFGVVLRESPPPEYLADVTQ